MTKTSTQQPLRVFLKHPALWCAVAMLAALALCRPWVNIPFCDDFAYIWCSRVLADTGHMVYNGGEAAMLGWQMYLGALWIKLFGLSFVGLHAVMLLVAVPTVILLQRVLVRLGLTETNATVVTLTVVLSPLFLPLAFSFMSDVPGLLVYEVCIYACLRAWSAETERAAYGWLILAAVSDDLGATVRQIAWLGALLLVPVTAWMLRRKWRSSLVVGAVLWVLSAGFIFGCIHWYVRQPYSINEKLFPPLSNAHELLSYGLYMSREFAHIFPGVLLYGLPVVIAFLMAAPGRRYSARRLGIVWGSAVLITAALALYKRQTMAPHHLELLAPFSQDWVNVTGLYVPNLVGDPPSVFPMAVRLLLTVVMLASYGLLVLVARDMWRERKLRLKDAACWPLATMLLPFAAANMVLIVTRRPPFERYYLPMLPLFLAAIFRLYQVWGGGSVQRRLQMATLAVFVAFSVMTTHDFYAIQRARLQAIAELQQAGIPRSHFYAGFEYDGWTQLQLTQVWNDSRLTVPKDAYHPSTPPPVAPECVPWSWDRAGAVRAWYELSYQPLPCAAHQTFAPVGYSTWLAPRHRELYILDLPR